MKRIVDMARPAQKPNTIKKSKVGGSKLDQQKLEKANIRTVMQAFHGCRKNCRQCKDDEAANFGEPKTVQKEVKRG